MNGVTEVMLQKSTFDFAITMAIFVISFVIIAITTMIFIKVTRARRIGVTGGEFDPEEENPVADEKDEIKNE